jgi:hypothetical protein
MKYTEHLHATVLINMHRSKWKTRIRRTDSNRLHTERNVTENVHVFTNRKTLRVWSEEDELGKVKTGQTWVFMLACVSSNTFE